MNIEDGKITHNGVEYTVTQVAPYTSKSVTIMDDGGFTINLTEQHGEYWVASSAFVRESVHINEFEYWWDLVRWAISINE